MSQLFFGNGTLNSFVLEVLGAFCYIVDVCTWRDKRFINELQIAIKCHYSGYIL